MAQKRLRAIFMRGGTSKAVVFRREDLPADRADWDAIFLLVMGSPDPHGRQLDGMGGGISSLSKVCIVGVPSHPQADIDYTFAQVSVGEATVDYAGNCGNMSSAMGPFAVDEGIVAVAGAGQAVVRIHNTNTGKLIHATFGLDDGRAAVEGDLVIDGVAGSGAPIRLDFIRPDGSKTGRLLPTGQPLDVLDAGIQASMIDAANPCVFVDAAAFGKTGTETAEALESDGGLMQRLEALRQQAALRMGLAASEAEAAAIQSIPKIAIVAAPRDHWLASDVRLAAGSHDICIRMISMQRPHRAVPITGAVCLAVAMRLEGSLPARLATGTDGMLRIAHPSGVIAVDARLGRDADGAPVAEYGSVYRTARRLFEGQVLCR